MSINEINIDFDSDLRQLVLKLANTYEPKFELKNNNFENPNEILTEFSQLICQDFSSQLYPMILDRLHEKMNQQQQ